jgi:hypothetical protein
MLSLTKVALLKAIIYFMLKQNFAFIHPSGFQMLVIFESWKLAVLAIPRFYLPADPNKQRKSQKGEGIYVVKYFLILSERER